MPARRRELHLSIGDIHISIASVDRDLRLAARGPVARFLVDQHESDIAVDARWSDLDGGADGRPLFDSGGLWRLYEAGGQLKFNFTSPRFGAVPYKTALFERGFSKGIVFLHRPYFDASVATYPLEYPLDEIVMTNWLALGRGVEMHGCAVRDSSGAGYLFAGQSGAGKTTLARLWRRQRDVTVLSDDRVILRKQADGIWMYGTPWHGDAPLAAPARARLTRGFFLRHSLRTELADLGRAETVARLLACSFPPFFSATGLEYTLVLLADIGRATPFCELGFAPGRQVVDFVRATS